MLTFVSNAIDVLVIGQNASRVGVISFSQNARTIFHLNTYYNKAALKNAVLNIPFDGGLTGIAGAFRLALSEFDEAYGDRPDAQNIAILITDGSSNIELQRTFPDAQSAKNNGIEVLCIGVTNNISLPTLQQISSLPQQLGKTYWIAPSQFTMNTLIAPLMTETCRPVTPSE